LAAIEVRQATLRADVDNGLNFDLVGPPSQSDTLPTLVLVLRNLGTGALLDSLSLQRGADSLPAGSRWSPELSISDSEIVDGVRLVLRVMHPGSEKAVEVDTMRVAALLAKLDLTSGVEQTVELTLAQFEQIATNAMVMGWIMDEYSSYYGFSPGVVTGKPLELFGSPGRDEATGRGVMYVLEEALRDRGRALSGVSVALQGFGNVGSHAARLIAEGGGRIVAVADYAGGVAKKDGLDVPSLVDWAAEHRTVAGFPDADAFDGAAIIGWDADVLIPAALEGAINKENVDSVRADIVVEGANGPTTPEAAEILNARDVTVVPDIFANAGGVTVSYFEWAQNIQQFRWELDRVRAELEKKMREAYAAVRDVAKQKQLDLRTAAFVLAIERVGRAALSRRSLREEIF
jgi:glutamate dehydrogenase/leucine dehydrogenase